MKKIQITKIACAVSAGLIIAGGLSVSAQTVIWSDTFPGSSGSSLDSASTTGISGEDEDNGASGDPEQDLLYDEAVKIVTSERKPSISYVQRRLKIGYNRAARMLEAMELAGIVGPLQSNGGREVLAPPPR